MQDKIKSFYASEVALMEHKLLRSVAISDWKPEDLQMYLMGVQDMADEIISAIHNGEGF